MLGHASLPGLCGDRIRNRTCAVKRRDAQRGPMTVPVETTAVMTPPAEQHDPAGAVADASVSASGAAAMSDSAAVAGIVDGSSEQGAGRRELSLGAVVTLFGGLATTLLGALIGLMMWQFNSLSDRIDNLGTDLRGEIAQQGSDLRGEIAQLESELRSEIGDLRTEMQAGFAEITVVLLDHTGRLARLETAAGLPRPTG